MFFATFSLTFYTARKSYLSSNVSLIIAKITFTITLISREINFNFAKFMLHCNIQLKINTLFDDNRDANLYINLYANAWCNIWRLKLSKILLSPFQYFLWKLQRRFRSHGVRLHWHFFYGHVTNLRERKLLIIIGHIGLMTEWFIYSFLLSRIGIKSTYKEICWTLDN